METYEQVSALADSFSSCARIFTAMGDETRQHLVVEMMRFWRVLGHLGM